MVNTWNTAELNEKVNNLNAKVDKIEANTLPDTSEATTGQILGLTGEDKTPEWVDASGGSGLPDYSTLEQNLGIKWIDGRDVYSKTYSGSNSHDKLLDASFQSDYEIIRADAYVHNSDVGFTLGQYDNSWKCQIIYIPNVGLTLQSGVDGGTFNVTVYYVKPAAVTKKTKK